MPFSEKVKKEIKQKSNFRCVVCGEPFVEVHHIKPQNEGGSDTIDNGVALCARCHDLFGGNPEKRKQIKEMRNHYYKRVEIMECSGVLKLHLNDEHYDSLKKEKAVAIYHVVYANENFEKSACMIMDLLYECEKKNPGERRILYLDIEGHRNSKGGFDHDMFELMKEFSIGYVLPYLSELFNPLAHLLNKNPQKNDVPHSLVVENKDKNTISRLSKDKDKIEEYSKTSESFIE